jgi:hypothetical protein
VAIGALAILTGSGAVTGDVTNQGTITPGGDGTIGTITISGNYSQAAGGVLQVDIARTPAGTQYDQLIVSGQATLGGVLSVNFVGRFVPAPKAIFDILVYGVVMDPGSFDTLRLPPLPGKLTWAISYGPDLVTLTVQPPRRR